MTSNYYIIVQDGTVFEGSLTEFKTKYYTCPEDWDDEKFIEFAREWAASNNWTIEVGMCH